jgi:hypothetical protein
MFGSAGVPKHPAGYTSAACGPLWNAISCLTAPPLSLLCVQVRGVKDSKSKGKKKKAAEEKVAPLPMDQAGAGPALPRDLAAEDGLEVLEA